MIAFVKYVISSFSLSTDWIKGILNFMEGYPDNAGQMTGLYLITISSIGSMIYIFLTFLGIMGIFFWPIALGEALILSVIELMVFTTLGMVGIIGGYFVFANSGGEELLKVAGILEMIGSFTSCIPFIGILGLLGVIIGVGMQLLNQFGVI